MDKFRFDYLEDEVKILGFGTLFRLQNGSQWSINIDYYPRQEKNYMRMSNAPVLARKRYLNETQQHKTPGFLREFTIDTTCLWNVKKIKDCPALKNTKREEAEQSCFVFDDDGVAIYLPQFELARALFFHDNYLSRTSLEPDYLAAEFDIKINRDVDRALVNVMISSNFSLKHFNDPGCRRVLSWILLDENARKSYESIGKHQKMNGYDVNCYRHWNFSFEPPPLPNTKFIVRGWIDNKTKSMFVYEIHGIRNIRAEVPSEVDFFHPDFEQSVHGSKRGAAASGNNLPSEHIIHDGITPSSDTQRVILRPDTIEIEFDKPIKTNRIANKKTSAKSGKKNDSEPDYVSKDASTDESDITGNLPGADWNNIDDQTDDAYLYINKFTCFFTMTRLLENKDECSVIRFPLRKLPSIPRCNKHLLTTDRNPRCLAVIEVSISGKIFHILEVDTSDADKPLSTKLLILKPTSSLERDLTRLEEELVRGSLRWPSKLLDQMCGKNNHHGIPHPKSGHKGELDSKSIEGWADRFYSRILGASRELT